MEKVSNTLLSKYLKTLRDALTKPRGSKAGTGNIPAKKSRFFRLSLDEQILFAKRLSVLLKAGVPILQALNILQAQTTTSNAKFMLADLLTGVEQGQFLHTRMEKYRKYFGDFAVNIVRVGEVSGSLNDNLGYLAHELKKKKDLRRKVVSALVYPAFIVVATLGIGLLLIVYVFPKILPILQSFKGNLPITTRILIFLSHLLTSKGWLILLFVIAFSILWVAVFRRFIQVRLWVHKMLLKIPVLGGLMQSYYMANFCRTFGVLLKSEVPIVETAGITANTSTNLAYQNSLENLTKHLTGGGRLSSFFDTESKLFPVLVAQMVVVGETTGTLSETLLYLADIYEQEVDDMTKNLSTAIEPMLMILMGLLVGFVAMSIITPIYSITQSLSR